MRDDRRRQTEGPRYGEMCSNRAESRAFKKRVHLTTRSDQRSQTSAAKKLPPSGEYNQWRIQGVGWTMPPWATQTFMTINKYGQNADYRNTKIVLAQQKHFINNFRKSHPDLQNCRKPPQFPRLCHRRRCWSLQRSQKPLAGREGLATTFYKRSMVLSAQPATVLAASRRWTVHMELAAGTATQLSTIILVRH